MMDTYLMECLNSQEPGKYIFPFFWQHGEDYEVLLEELCAIYNSGIREFCVESRPHEQFGEEPWWADMRFLLEEAKKRNMRVWLLDDKKFPTGYANGWIEKHPKLRKVSLRLAYMDVAGPALENAILANYLEEEESFVSIVAWKRDWKNNRFFEEFIDLSTAYKDGMVYFDVPEGVWRVFFVIRTRKSIPWKENYIDLLSEDSCRALLEAVYEPHYEHFGEYFGNTFAGFFFDEPGFANDDGTYHSSLGKPHMLVPWKDELLFLLKQELGEAVNVAAYLPGLWQEIGEYTAKIRVAYMDLVTKLASRNFSNLLGAWCEEHGVLSVGHLIEDTNAHMRLGYGMGHFFRGLEGQDMAGMDIVLGQIHPGIDGCACAAPVIEDTVDPAFFTYTLPKMTASHAHFCKKKKGRAMCEIFGAFGWAEGVPLMKKIADKMLVCGINYFVPHAFDPKYPDPECPPYFWARGNNPQYKLFGCLMSYMRRCGHLLSDGVHEAPVALLYYPEPEWAGKSYEPLERLAVKLSLNQIDFDILPEDVLMDAKVEKDRLLVHKEQYQVLLVPKSAYRSEKLNTVIQFLKEQGLMVWEIGEDQIEALPKKLYMNGVERILESSTQENPIRVYHYMREESQIYLFLNEDQYHSWNGNAAVKQKGVFYDPWKNCLHKAEVQDGTLQLHLYPGEMKVFVSGSYPETYMELDEKEEKGQQQLITGEYRISLQEKDSVVLYKETEKLVNLSRTEEVPEFSGKIRYETTFWAEKGRAYKVLDLGMVGETAEVWLNGEYIGARVTAPYCFSIKEKCKMGENRLCIEVVNNLAYKDRDFFSRYFQLPPSGLLGPVKMLYEEIDEFL